MGDNLLTIGVRDGQGMNMVAGKLRVVLEKPADNGGNAELLEFPVTEQSAGKYQATVNLPAEGEWPLLIEFSAVEGGHADLTFNMDTNVDGLALVTATPQGVTRHVCPMHPSVSQAEPGHALCAEWS